MKNQTLFETPWMDFKRWWTSVESPPSNYQHHPLLLPAANVINSAIAVVHIPSMKYIYTSPNFSEFTGWAEHDYNRDGVQFAFNRIPVNDQKGVIAFSSIITQQFKGVDDEKRHLFKSIWDFRLTSNKGEVYRVIQQDCPLRYNKSGEIEELLVIASKVNFMSVDSQHLRINCENLNRFYKYDHSMDKIHELPLLSPREMEIAILVARSNSLKQIASMLNISFNTVKVHSANIMEKLQVNDAIQMINLLRTWAFL